MKKLAQNLKITIPLTILAIATVAFLASMQNAQAAPPNRIYFDPSKPVAKVGEKFTVTVMVDVNDLRTIGVSIKWNSSFLNCTGITWGHFLDPSLLHFDGVINNVAGTAKGYAWTMTAAGGTSGTGSIIIVEFLVKDLGGSPLEFILGTSDTIMKDHNGVAMSFNAEKGYATLVQTLTHHIVWSTHEFDVYTTSNSTVTTVYFDQPNMRINFTVTGPSGTAGLCNVTIPKSMLNCLEGPEYWQIIIDSTDISSSCTITANLTHTFIYIPYTHSTHTIKVKGTWVVPEFPPNITLPLLIIASIAIITLIRRKQKR